MVPRDFPLRHFCPSEAGYSINPLYRESVSFVRMNALLIGVFVEDTGSLILALKEAVEKGDSDKMRMQAHILIGASGSVGAQIMEELAREIELQGEVIDAAISSVDALASRAAEAVCSAIVAISETDFVTCFVPVKC